MTERDRLMAALFANPAREHIDVKFFLGRTENVTEEDLCKAALNMFDQIDAAGDGDRSFVEAFESKEIKELIAAL